MAKEKVIRQHLILDEWEHLQGNEWIPGIEDQNYYQKVEFGEVQRDASKAAIIYDSAITPAIEYNLSPAYYNISDGVPAFRHYVITKMRERGASYTDIQKLNDFDVSYNSDENAMVIEMLNGIKPFQIRIINKDNPKMYMDEYKSTSNTFKLKNPAKAKYYITVTDSRGNIKMKTFIIPATE